MAIGLRMSFNSRIFSYVLFTIRPYFIRINAVVRQLGKALQHR